MQGCEHRCWDLSPVGLRVGTLKVPMHCHCVDVCDELLPGSGLSGMPLLGQSSHFDLTQPLTGTFCVNVDAGC